VLTPQQCDDLIAHLDPLDETNGRLRVPGGSHRQGVLTAQDIARLRQDLSETCCDMNRGDALLMRPLLLHASSKSTTARHRRVLHIEYAGFPLPAGLQWHQHL